MNGDIVILLKNTFMNEELIIGKIVELDDKVSKISDKLDDLEKSLPSKVEFYGTMDKVMQELRAIRQESTFNNNRVDNLEIRVKKLEQTVGI